MSEMMWMARGYGSRKNMKIGNVSKICCIGVKKIIICSPCSQFISNMGNILQFYGKYAFFSLSIVLLLFFTVVEGQIDSLLKIDIVLH